MVDFSDQDLKQIQQRGSSVESVNYQMTCFKNGFKYCTLDRAATINDGIVQLDEDVIEEWLADYPFLMEGKKSVKFVPASGAATRMFKELYGYLSDDSPVVEEKAMLFLQQIPNYPFYEALSAVLRCDGSDIDQLIQAHDYKKIIHYLLDPVGLNYGNQAKGLLPFHRYDKEIHTAAEEHLVEAALMAQGHALCTVHFTVSPQHQKDFESLMQKVVPLYEKRFDVSYNIEYSVQDPATDTIAAELNNTPFRDENGQLLFRPAGHGALINNLNNIDADLVFVKNIDNVASEEKVASTIQYKKLMAAYAVQLQNRVFQYLKELEAGEVDEMLLCEILDFAESDLMISLEDDFSVDSLFEKLNRPIRVCGMVKNEGEPGGGPFWVVNAEEEIGLQIVESSQINKEDKEQVEIMQQSTHFNPVDMVCCLKNYKGEKFNLLNYVDPDTAFISSKSYGDRILKALEAPGLWNGAMSQWITLFVEVPIETFNPVKTVFDLLR